MKHTYLGGAPARSKTPAKSNISSPESVLICSHTCMHTHTHTRARTRVRVHTHTYTHHAYTHILSTATERRKTNAQIIDLALVGFEFTTPVRQHDQHCTGQLRSHPATEVALKREKLTVQHASRADTVVSPPAVVLL